MNGPSTSPRMLGFEIDEAACHQTRRRARPSLASSATMPAAADATKQARARLARLPASRPRRGGSPVRRASNFHISMPVSGLSAKTAEPAVRYIRPSMTSGVTWRCARRYRTTTPAASRPTFCLLIWVSGECRCAPASRPNDGQSPRGLRKVAARRPQSMRRRPEGSRVWARPRSEASWRSGTFTRLDKLRASSRWPTVPR